MTTGPIETTWPKVVSLQQKDAVRSLGYVPSDVQLSVETAIAFVLTKTSGSLSKRTAWPAGLCMNHDSSSSWSLTLL